jgi:hypothetical protein
MKARVLAEFEDYRGHVLHTSLCIHQTVSAVEA